MHSEKISNLQLMLNALLYNHSAWIQAGENHCENYLVYHIAIITESRDRSELAFFWSYLWQNTIIRGTRGKYYQVPCWWKPPCWTRSTSGHSEKSRLQAYGLIFVNAHIVGPGHREYMRAIVGERKHEKAKWKHLMPRWFHATDEQCYEGRVSEHKDS